jgi:hypothetical protein
MRGLFPQVLSDAFAGQDRSLVAWGQMVQPLTP